MTIDEKALALAAQAIADERCRQFGAAAGREPREVEFDYARAAILAYESAKQKEAKGWCDIASACPTILKAAQKLATDRVSGKVVVGCYGDVPAVEFKRLAALLSAGGEG